MIELQFQPKNNGQNTQFIQEQGKSSHIIR